MATDSKIIEWVLKLLKKPLLDVSTVVETPWSSVLKINTGNEFFYLKHTPELIALEPRIIQILRDQFNAPVPLVIAHNMELNCFLMKDAGESLRGILKQKFDAALLCRAIEQFTALQLAVSDRLDVLLEIGVPDWRLNKLPYLYRKVISQKDLLIEDGISEVEINELEALLPKLTYLCQKLSDYSIKQTMVQPDFNDNNTLVDELKNITIIDLGEIAISHPFFSLLNCLQQVIKHYGLTESDDAYIKIKDSCLKNYMSFESKKNVLDAFEIAQVLWFVYGVLAHDRLMKACGKEKLMPFPQGKFSRTLKELITACKMIDKFEK